MAAATALRPRPAGTANGSPTSTCTCGRNRRRLRPAGGRCRGSRSGTTAHRTGGQPAGAVEHRLDATRAAGALGEDPDRPARLQLGQRRQQRLPVGDVRGPARTGRRWSAASRRALDRLGLDQERHPPRQRPEQHGAVHERGWLATNSDRAGRPGSAPCPTMRMRYSSARSDDADPAAAVDALRTAGLRRRRVVARRRGAANHALTRCPARRPAPSTGATVSSTARVREESTTTASRRGRNGACAAGASRCVSRRSRSNATAARSFRRPARTRAPATRRARRPRSGGSRRRARSSASAVRIDLQVRVRHDDRADVAALDHHPPGVRQVPLPVHQPGPDRRVGRHRRDRDSDGLAADLGRHVPPAEPVLLPAGVDRGVERQRAATAPPRRRRRSGRSRRRSTASVTIRYIAPVSR